MRRAVLSAVAVSLLLHVLVTAQQVTPNVNALSGTEERTGDAFLQRQNEGVVAASTRNPDHLIIAMNDYRTVDMAIDTAADEGNEGFIARLFGRDPARRIEAVRAQTPPEAWIGLAFSRDRGRTWYTSLLAGHPYDTTDVGRQSPVYGDSAGSDPVLITGQNGRVYLIALTFDRAGISRISSSLFEDPNNVEGGEPFYYRSTRQIDRASLSSKGIFVDKPSGAAYAGGGASVFATSGVSKKKKHVVAVPGCERVYTAWTAFEGAEANGNFRNSVYISMTASCNDVWSPPTKISGPYSVGGVNYPGTRNQGTSVAVDPDTGHVFVMWRTYEPNGFVYVRSTDGGLTFSSPQPVTPAATYLYDQPLLMANQGTNVSTFRSNAYPALMMYDGKLVAVWTEKVDLATGWPSASGDPRVVMSVGRPNSDGTFTWTPRRAIDLNDPGVSANTRCEQEVPEGETSARTVCRPAGAQVMPFVTAREGQIMVSYYESRHQQDAPGGLAEVSPGQRYISGVQRQVDVRGALIDPSAEDPALWPTVTSFQISRYPIDPATGRIVENPSAPLPQLKKRVSYANFDMYRGGLASFIGDYLHGIPLRPDASGAGFRFVFTSNELVDPPPLGPNGLPDFTQYSKPQTGTVSGCNPGSRNSTIMTAEVGTSLIVGSPGTFKQLLDGNGNPLLRAFAVYFENHTNGHRVFRLTFSTVSPGVQASFAQFTPVPQVDIEVLAFSSLTRTVFLSGAVATGSAVLNVQEVSVPGYAPSLNLSASLTLNGDSTNPFVGGAGGNPGLANTETHTPQLATPQLGTPQLGTPQIGTPQLGTPQLGTPQLGTPQLGTPQLSTPQLGTTGPGDPTITDIIYKVYNIGNTASGFNSLVSLATAPQLASTGHTFQVFVYRVHQSAAAKGCGIGRAQQDQVIYMTPQLGTPQLGTPNPQAPQLGTPQLGTPQLGTPQLGTPQLGTPQLGTPQLATATFTVAPPDPTPDDHDGTDHEHQSDDVVWLALRIYHPTESEGITHNSNAAFYTELANSVAVAVQAQAANTGETEPDDSSYGPDLQVQTPPIVTPEAVFAGGSVTLTTFVVANTGNVGANAPNGTFTHGIYLSDDPTFGSTDVLLATRQNQNSDLPPFSTYEIGTSTTVTIPPTTTAGPRYLLLVLDNANTVAESDEADNVFAMPITILQGILEFTVQPASTPAGKRVNGAPQVRAYYIDGETQVPVSGTNVSVTLTGNEEGSTLFGTTAVASGLAGVASLGNIWVDKPGTPTPGSAAVGSYTLTATAVGFTPAVSSSFDVTNKRILIYGDSFVEIVPGGNPDETPNERTFAEDLGFQVSVRNEATTPRWSETTTAEFAAFNAVVFPDLNHHHDIPTHEDFDLADSTKAIWSPALTGPKVLIGTDPIFHKFIPLTDPPQLRTTAVKLITNGMLFASGTPDAGLYVTLSIEFYDANVSTPVTFLSGIGAFEMQGRTSDVATVVPANAAHPVVAGLTSADLSSWGTSVHEIFTVFPATWKVLAVEGTDPTMFPYIIADR